MPIIAKNEAARLAEVERYRRSGAMTGNKLHHIVKLAAKTFGFDHVNITTHYAEDQVVHVHLGEMVMNQQRRSTFCLRPVETGETLVVHDLTQNELFKTFPNVIAHPHLRFYAGAPLISPNGFCLGTLCLLDTKPRQFGPRDAELLADLADLVVEHMELMRLTEEATYDQLTGLRNRPFLLDTMQASIDAGRPSTVLLIDLDGFKEINDSLGHTSGDEALVHAAERLTEFSGKDRLIARLGGDEFVVFIDDLNDVGVAAEIATNLVSRLGEPITIYGHVVHFGASVGVALKSLETKAIQLLGNADLAMYQAKGDGRNCYRIFSRSLRNTALERGNIVLEMQEAWEGGDFELYYQPIVCLPTGVWTGAEALLRWNYPYRGVLQPSEFLPILEKSHLAVDVGSWIIDEACRQAALWRAQITPDFTMAVNLFELQLKSGTLVAVVTDALDRHGLPPQTLQLELTERIVLAQDQQIIDQVRELRRLGVGIAFDDFGTGFASLSALKSYPVSCIKIDRSFMTGLATDIADLSIVTSLINLAKSLSLDTVAEGIETREQRSVIESQPGVRAQGFLFSKPQTAARFEVAWSASSSAPSASKIA
ncbi:EAL domain-containing protein [Jiella sp. MQZ9-1]|uniref:EAL domain-containing protein n=1 Tax=Jiella flava TaxID=2816857 RepID=A0A939JUV3_9HYPH|nr:EAL domain-containing protein [Jiella flava]MBO0663545.1 EAL domain-containing protein [Jiella flava]MCD2472120.1 EAL domain-containing protein [Jiella flava]